MANESGVLVVAEIHEGEIAGLTTELLGLARRLVDGGAGGKVSAALLGSGVAPGEGAGSASAARTPSTSPTTPAWRPSRATPGCRWFSRSCSRPTRR